MIFTLYILLCPKKRSPYMKTIINLSYKNMAQKFFCYSVFFLLAFLVVMPLAFSQTIDGTVFRDFDSDGAVDGTEPGISGVLVTAVGADSSTYSSVTGADGSYSIDVSGSATGTRFRVEFTNTPLGLLPGAFGLNSGTTVNFANSPASSLDLALQYPADFCDADPTVVTNCYIQGDNSVSTEEVLVSFPYSASGADAHISEAAADEIGSTFGLAYHRRADTLFMSSYMKRHSGYGPSGTGAIYAKNMDSGVISTYIDFNSLLGAGTAGVDVHPAGTSFDFSVDENGWDPVGKVAFGDLDITADDRTLFTINLETQELYQIDISNFPAAVTAGNVQTFSFPAPANCPVPGTNLRAQGIGIRDDLVYVGLVCTAETTQLTSDLHAYVYTFDPSTSSFSASPVLSFDLDYERGCVTQNPPTFCANAPGGGGVGDAEWLPWVNVFTVIGTVFGGAGGGEVIYPQPILSDLDFTDSGDILIGIRDRAGDQFGFRQASTAGAGIFSGDSAGDLLIACSNGDGTWTLEADGSCGVFGPTGGQGNTEGPGGGEFYFTDDFFDTSFSAILHQETSLGGLAVRHGDGQMLQTQFDVSDDFQGGIAWHDDATGGRNQSLEIYDTSNGGGVALDNTLGKAAGLGDVELLCSPAPIEIGNFVWLDANRDGIQDPGESPLANVTVTLHDMSMGGALAGTAVTDSNGQYYFGGVSATNLSVSSIKFDTQYEVRVSLNQAPLVDLIPTITSAGSNESIDSNGVLSTTNSVSEVTTGFAGANDHTIDFGFSEPSVLVGDYVWFDRDLDGIQDPSEPAYPGVTVSLMDMSTGLTIATTVTDENGLYFFDQDDGLSPGGSNKVCLDNPADYTSSGPLRGVVSTISNQGGDDGLDSDAEVLDGFPCIVFTAPDSGEDLTLDFGLVPEAPITDLTPLQFDIDGRGNALLVSARGGVQSRFRGARANQCSSFSSSRRNRQRANLNAIFTDDVWTIVWTQLSGSNYNFEGFEVPIFCVQEDVSSQISTLTGRVRRIARIGNKALNGCNEDFRRRRVFQRQISRRLSDVIAAIDSYPSQLGSCAG